MTTNTQGDSPLGIFIVPARKEVLIEAVNF